MKTSLKKTFAFATLVGAAMMPLAACEEITTEPNESTFSQLESSRAKDVRKAIDLFQRTMDYIMKESIIQPDRNQLEASAISKLFELAAAKSALPFDFAALNTKDGYGNALLAVARIPGTDLNIDALNTKVLQSVVSTLSPHDSFLDSKDLEDFRLNTFGKFGGIGIEVSQPENQPYIRIIAPRPDSPAERAGLAPGDMITHIDGKSVAGMPLSNAVQLMRGLLGLEVSLTIQRPGVATPFVVTMAREAIRIDVTYRTVGEDVGYLRVPGFNAYTDYDVEKAVASLKSKLGQNLKGLVIDLRNNPGGSLNQAIAMVDNFIDQPGQNIVTVDAVGTSDDREFLTSASQPDIVHGIPIIVLTNAGSASASEIVAGSLQDLGRALIFGEYPDTYGKATMQSIIPLGDGKAIKLTTGIYRTPRGHSIQGFGITSDEVCPLQDDKTATPGEEANENSIANPDVATNPDASKIVAECEITANLEPALMDQDTLVSGKPDRLLQYAVDRLRGENRHTVRRPIPKTTSMDILPPIVKGPA